MSADKTFSWGADGFPTAPRYRSVMVIELIASVLVIVFVAGSLVNAGTESISRLHMMQPLSEAGLMRNEAMEWLAITGGALATNAAGRVTATEAVEGAEYERHLSGAIAARAAEVKESAAKGGKGKDFRDVARVGIVDGNVRIIGRLRDDRPAYELWIMPTMAAPEFAATVGWSCGDGPIVRGHRVLVPRPATAGAHALPAFCRKEGP
jgi:hypothetical protein